MGLLDAVGTASSGIVPDSLRYIFELTRISTIIQDVKVTKILQYLFHFVKYTWTKFMIYLILILKRNWPLEKTVYISNNQEN